MLNAKIASLSSSTLTESVGLTLTIASLSHTYILDSGTARSNGCPFQRPPQRVPLLVFPAPGPQTFRVRHCILDAPLPADNIGQLTHRLGSFYEPNMTFKLTTSCARNQIQYPLIQIACHKDNTDRKLQLVVSVSSVSSAH